MEKKTHRPFLLVAFGVILFAVLMNLSQVIGFIKKAGNLILPVILGFMLAFILNVPLRGFENLIVRLTKNRKRKPNSGTLTVLSLLLTVISVFLVVAVVCAMLIPEVVSSAVSLYELIRDMWPKWLDFFQQHGIDVSWLAGWVEMLSLDQLVQQLLSGAGSLITSAFGVVSTTVSYLGNFFVSIIIAIYALLGKKDLARHSKKLILAHCSDRVSDFLLHIARLINSTFSKFLSGQCLEACILGGLLFLVFTILGIPYASLIGVLALVLSFLPYVGSFLTCVLGVFLVLLTQPSKALICLIAYLVVQFVETQLIYPHVVGTSVGLSPLWTLIAVLIGGKLMGLFGMIFFIPLTAVLVTLLKESTNQKLSQKHITIVQERTERLDE